jgi:hypothetical protein
MEVLKKGGLGFEGQETVLEYLKWIAKDRYVWAYS